MAFSSVTSGGGFQLAEAETFHMLPVSHENICFLPLREFKFCFNEGQSRISWFCEIYSGRNLQEFGIGLVFIHVYREVIYIYIYS